MLAEALVRAGKDEEAKIAFAEFESKALAESEGFDNANRELTFYFADHADKPKEALRIAELEIARRQDLQTLHAYAWALYVNGKFAEAREQIDKALAVGTRDPALLYHAGVIAMKAGDTVMAQRHLEASLAQTPNSEVATSARDALAAFQK